MAMLFRYTPKAQGSPPRLLIDKAVHALKVFRSPVSTYPGAAVEIGPYRLHLSQREAVLLLTELQAVIAYNENWQASHERCEDPDNQQAAS